MLWIHLSKSPLFLKSLIDSGSPYVLIFSCLVVQFYIYVNMYVHIYACVCICMYIYINFNALLNVYHQGYVVCNLSFLIFFIFYCACHIHRKKTSTRNLELFQCPYPNRKISKNFFPPSSIRYSKRCIHYVYFYFHIPKWIKDYGEKITKLKNRFTWRHRNTTDLPDLNLTKNIILIKPFMHNVVKWPNIL